jgi:hypothetical protein
MKYNVQKIADKKITLSTSTTHDVPKNKCTFMRVTSDGAVGGSDGIKLSNIPG